MNNGFSNNPDLFYFLYFGQLDQKLISAKTGHHIPFTQTPGYSAGHLFQHLISAEVPYRVIHIFKGIQIYKKNTNRLTVLTGRPNTLFQLILE
ncbi:hypothetical protein D3C71_1650770 [compost metagenome]